MKNQRNFKISKPKPTIIDQKAVTDELIRKKQYLSSKISVPTLLKQEREGFLKIGKSKNIKVLEPINLPEKNYNIADFDEDYEEEKEIGTAQKNLMNKKIDIKKFGSSNIKQQNIDPLAFDCEPYEIDDMEEDVLQMMEEFDEKIYKKKEGMNDLEKMEQEFQKRKSMVARMKK